ncbi:hypothetical protein K3Z86_16380, partial [Pseudomonas aeruginosa]|nr:hypothetical protein [Pseudomonas aeruginosa]
RTAVVVFPVADDQLLGQAGESWYSKGQNSPFVGHCLPGRVRYTLVDGHLTHEG